MAVRENSGRASITFQMADFRLPIAKLVEQTSRNHLLSGMTNVEERAASSSGDCVAMALRGFGPLGILAILVILAAIS